MNFFEKLFPKSAKSEPEVEPEVFSGIMQAENIPTEKCEKEEPIFHKNIGLNEPYENVSLNEIKSLLYLKYKLTDINNSMIQQLINMLTKEYQSVPCIGNLTINEIVNKYNHKTPDRSIENIPIKKVIELVKLLESQEGGKDICKFCCTNEINCVFIECGHFVSCTECAMKLNGTCSYCRKPFYLYPIHRV